ncbi:MAG: tRNA (guanosine(46)-N7)-methyltransferase TrmB [Blautia sp.]|nr:tRNA (guanosine(46)-N7)-methyltransferase TrmB [Eubacteriales bacterium]MED9966869.1 tRNA (guanosine(46)-N7)-methyltransferase TrmB [Blautia sp.]
MRLRNIPGAQDAILESPYVIQKPEAHKGVWAEVFPKKQPLHIEVGMGKGRFLMDLARLNPDINYVGIEMYDSVLLRALQKREELEEEGTKYENLFFMRVDARLLPEIFEKGEVDKIYLNFSDPWPKARHAKRRLTSREFLERYDQILVPDGTVEFKTDNRELFEFSLEEVNETKWNLLAHTFDLHHNEEMVKGNVMTEYEEKFSSMGNPICKMIINR